MTVSDRHKDRVAVVTGAARGLGRAHAVRLASEGASVVLVDITDTAESEAAVKKAGAEVLGVLCDIGDEKRVSALAAEVRDRFGGCDILVNNAAAIPPSTSYAELSLETWDRTLKVNLDGMFLLSRAFTPAMCEKGWGRVVNISSNTFGQVMAGRSAYITTKAGVIGFTRALASEVGRFGVTVNAILPGLIKTEHSAEGLVARGDGSFEERAQRQAIPRVGLPEDIANVVSFLASDDASFMTAQSVVVDGGLLRH